MSNEDIVLELAESCALVRRELDRKSPRQAAKFACEGLRKLGDHGSFWHNFNSALEDIEKYRDGVKQVLTNLVDFIDLEGAILEKLKVATPEAEAILADVYGMVGLTENAPPELTAFALESLRRDVQKAADYICLHSRGKLRRALDWVLSVKGLRVLGGGTVVAANFTAIHAPILIAPYLSPALVGLQPVLLPASMSLGGLCMGKEAGEVVNIFKPEPA